MLPGSEWIMGKKKKPITFTVSRTFPVLVETHSYGASALLGHELEAVVAEDQHGTYRLVQPHLCREWVPSAAEGEFPE